LGASDDHGKNRERILDLEVTSLFPGRAEMAPLSKPSRKSMRVSSEAN
jgi:hypothetical protein